jgi:hypothetical protein
MRVCEKFRENLKYLKTAYDELGPASQEWVLARLPHADNLLKGPKTNNPKSRGERKSIRETKRNLANIIAEAKVLKETRSENRRKQITAINEKRQREAIEQRTRSEGAEIERWEVIEKANRENISLKNARRRSQKKRRGSSLPDDGFILK